MRKKQTSYVPCPETISLILMNTSTTNNKFLLYTRGIEFRVQGIRMRRCGGIVERSQRSSMGKQASYLAKCQ